MARYAKMRGSAALCARLLPRRLLMPPHAMLCCHAILPPLPHTRYADAADATSYILMLLLPLLRRRVSPRCLR